MKDTLKFIGVAAGALLALVLGLVFNMYLIGLCVGFIILLAGLAALISTLKTPRRSLEIIAGVFLVFVVSFLFHAYIAGPGLDYMFLLVVIFFLPLLVVGFSMVVILHFVLPETLPPTKICPLLISSFVIHSTMLEGAFILSKFFDNTLFFIAAYCAIGLFLLILVPRFLKQSGTASVVCLLFTVLVVYGYLFFTTSYPPSASQICKQFSIGMSKADADLIIEKYKDTPSVRVHKSTVEDPLTHKERPSYSIRTTHLLQTICQISFDESSTITSAYSAIEP